MAEDVPDPQALIRLARQTLSSSERRKKYRRIDFLDASYWYPSQKAFFLAGSSGVHQRLIYGGNQSGKTLSAAFEVALHMTGDYPFWWTGKRFDKPIRVWAVGESGQLVRDTLQKKLCGDDEFGTGMIPLESFAKRPVMVPGGTGAVDTMFVAHQTDGVADGTSSLTYKSFEMRREKLQGESVDVIWIDERPGEDIYSELLARTSATDGHLIVSYTPVGDGAAAGVTYKFLSEPSSDRAVFRIPSAEVKHISEARREELSSGYSEHEREARIEGTPQLGAGPIFPIELLPTISKSFNPDTDIPTYARWCVGIDFGYGHPFAAALIAWAHDTGQVWLVDSFRMERSSALYHVQRIHAMTRGLRIPVAWPHDGSQHDKGSGLPLADQYKNFGANMMPSHAVNHGTKTNAVEPALAEIRELMFLGKLTIAIHNGELFEEMRNYHRDENFRVVKQRDDLVSAMRYAVMMRRRGKPLSECDGVGYGGYSTTGQRQTLGNAPQIARGLDFDVFTGE
ncbi:terminase family protein [Bradyrhizobium sp. SSUT18]|uniref:terminase large subunit domain-containing protein n=1 Tax=Bradyrhizobium sp. SSUT18 TaxID=3040602 RepID=UPI002446E1C3|nr:terminase family protein [Bradyrhizobium sp. SSUT18]MDH2400784.1 terminase family protein [Bradyrhizobium sp. SSUT18]